MGGRGWRPYAVLAVGWLVALACCYPGYLTTDSVDQLEQARGVIPVHDWFPPLMTWQWRIVDAIVAGPFLMLAIQTVTFLLGVFGILRTMFVPLAAAIASACILLFVPVFAPMAVIWKDSQMAGYLLAGIACLLSPRRAWRIAGCVLLVLATAQRYNAFAATLPIVVVLFEWRPGLSRWRRYGIAFAAWIAITACAAGCNRMLTDRETHAWHGSVALFDIAGTLSAAPSMSDDEVRELLGALAVNAQTELQAAIRARHSPRAWWVLVRGDHRVFDAPHTAEERAAVSRAWRAVVTSYPGTYLEHRLRAFQHLVAFATSPTRVTTNGFSLTPDQVEAVGSPQSRTAIQRAWLSVLEHLQTSFLFRPWIYFLVGLALVVIGRRERLVLALTLSGLVNELSLVIAAPSADYRYSHWMITAVVVGAILAVPAWRGRRRARREPLEPPS